jgi:hypothetical protein
MTTECASLALWATLVAFDPTFSCLKDLLDTSSFFVRVDLLAGTASVMRAGKTSSTPYSNTHEAGQSRELIVKSCLCREVYCIMIPQVLYAGRREDATDKLVMNV